MKCKKCNGEGYTIEVERFGKPSAVERYPDCDRCAGTGQEPASVGEPEEREDEHPERSQEQN